ncbi:probable methyltransferase At1g29790 [Zingiber officinale]|uniref:S-adenosyl-L-methionine-dependent methyltransferase superfamily protein n=1 Tax=Zingiber officinale TaxID=94328 RepID=A0A8J5LFP5_ZINOF|nr:probable methyltransferase At1g29790 [Zingiber officinale]KAG6517112.1 hypothetical protein ZIOFF_020492 [Zingiber officinale]
MRSPRQQPRVSWLGIKRRVYTFALFLALLAFLLTLTSLSRFYSQTSSSFTVDAFAALLTAGDTHSVGDSTVDRVIAKIVSQLENLRERPAVSPQYDRKLRHERDGQIAFLTEILGLVVSLKESPQPVRRDAPTTSQGAQHPLSRGERSHHELVEYFLVEEIRKYVKAKPNRLGKQNFMGANGTFASIGHACFAMKEELEEYMDYDVGDFCKDDWKQAQRLMVHGCDPLPRRRCFAAAPKLYTRPRPIADSLWNYPDDRNVLWSHYKCKSFACLARNATGKGFFKCSECFNLTHHELPRWMSYSYVDPARNSTADFLIEEVLEVKPGEIRVGLDYSVGTGSFAARMREFNVTVVSATINLGAPFSETIALRGLVPLYVTVNQRLPFFDNTLDMIHTTRFLDGWIDFVLLDFVLYDWDRVLRPGGLLWIDSFFCHTGDLEDYLEAFEVLRYKKHRWTVVPKVDKAGKEVFFSALLEKPPRPL